ncbi:MAG: energy-coupling factor transporter transmembrane protein EcfT [Oscillospiraceae bacterium]|nr:energy-coupling factor transporter transmembrane protein EcfT [Oscillospiraceae bacterium]
MGFSACHPAINFIYFACVIAVTLCIPHPIFLAISLLCAFAYTVKLNRTKGAVFSAVLVPCAAAFALWYSSYSHFGVTVLNQNFIENNITLEALVYGLVLGFMVAGAMIWFSCVHAVFTTDKVVYLFGKVSPRLSLFLAILLRMVPRIKQQAKKLNTAQRGIGMAVDQGNILERSRNCIRIFSMLITWTIDMLTNASESMQSRGSTLRGRTAFSIYRFDNRDRAYVITLFTAMIVLGMGLLFRQGYISYSPVIRMNPVTPLSFVFYAGYAVLCLMPLGLDLWTEYCFKKARCRI